MVYQKCLKLSINTVYTNDFGNLNLSRQMVISVISNLIFFVHVDLCEAKTYWELCSGLDVERPYPDRRCISVAIPGGVMLGMSVKVFCLMSSAFNVPNLPNISWKIFGRLRDLLLKSGWPKNTWMVSQKTKRFWEESRIVAATLLPAARTFIFADSWRGSTNSAWFFVLWLRWGSFFFQNKVSSGLCLWDISKPVLDVIASISQRVPGCRSEWFFLLKPQRLECYQVLGRFLAQDEHFGSTRCAGVWDALNAACFVAGFTRSWSIWRLTRKRFSK